MRRLALALFALVAIAALAAGCGGGGSSTDATTGGGGEEAAPTKAQFVAKADAICKANDATLNKEVQEFAKEEGISEKSEPSEDQQTELVERFLIPSLQNEHDELVELTPPEGDEEKVEQIFSNLEAGIEEAEVDPSSMTEEEEHQAFEEASQEAGDYGMKVCGAE
jgi:protein-tyrosine-phosphatase